MIVVTASTRLYFLPSCSKCSSRKFSFSQTRRKSCNLEFRVNWRCRIYRDMADILRSPQVCEKLSLASLDLLKGKEVLEKLLAMQLVSKDFSTGNEATATFLDNWNVITTTSKKSLLGYFFSNSPFPSSGKRSDLDKIPVLKTGLDECGRKGNRTYLVVGGIRGYGIEVARWMAENGTKSTGLIGR